MVQVIETWEGNISDSLKLRQFEDEHLGCGTGVKSVAKPGSAMEIYGGFVTGSCFSRGLVLDASSYDARESIYFENQGCLIPMPLLFCLSQSGAPLPSSEDIKLGHVELSSGEINGSAVPDSLWQVLSCVKADRPLQCYLCFYRSGACDENDVSD